MSGGLNIRLSTSFGVGKKDTQDLSKVFSAFIMAERLFPTPL